MLAAIAKFLADGGPWMYPIAAVSVIALAVCIERVVFVFFLYNINGRTFMAQVQKQVLANNIDRAIRLCNAAPNAALSRVVKAGLLRANRGEVEIRSAIEEVILEVLPLLQKRTPSLVMLANLATLLGLLGTVVGLTQAFGAVSAAPPEQRAEQITGAIAVAMNTTAFGLLVAVPSLFAHLLLAGASRQIVADIDLYSVRLENMLVARGKGGAEPTEKNA